MTTSKLDVAALLPLPLFDPARGELPPLDAIEVYLEPPPSLSLLHSECLTTGQYPQWVPHLEAAWAAGQAAALKTFVSNLQIKVGRHQDRPGLPSVGQYLAGRLSITHVPHLCVPGTEPFSQMHDHFYIAPTAIPDPPRCMSMAGTSLLAPWDAGQQWPVDIRSMRMGFADLLDALYQGAIQKEVTARIGSAWIPGRRGAPAVVDGCQDVVGDFPRIMCPGLPRAQPDPPLSRERVLAEALAAEPDAIEERQAEIGREVGSKLLRAAHPLRLVLRDIVDPPPVDPDP